MSQDQLIENIEKALEEIRPFLNSDGGDIKLVAIEEDKHVKVRFEGASRPSEIVVLGGKAGVETTIKRYAPQIETVENVL